MDLTFEDPIGRGLKVTPVHITNCPSWEVTFEDPIGRGLKENSEAFPSMNNFRLGTERLLLHWCRKSRNFRKIGEYIT